MRLGNSCIPILLIHYNLNTSSDTAHLQQSHDRCYILGFISLYVKKCSYILIILNGLMTLKYRIADLQNRSFDIPLSITYIASYQISFDPRI